MVYLVSQNRQLPKIVIESQIANRNWCRLAGVYTITVSTFEAGKVGDFELVVEASLPVGIVAIPQEGAGMHQRVIKGSWYVPDRSWRMKTIP